MPDPRFTDLNPRSSDPNDPRFFDPDIRRGEAIGGAWVWMATIGSLLLIGFLIIASNNSNTASNNSSPIATSSAPARTSPSTTGSGSYSPQPTSPAPSKPSQ